MTRSTDSRGVRWLGLSACAALICAVLLVAGAHAAPAGGTTRAPAPVWVQIPTGPTDDGSGRYGYFLPTAAPAQAPAFLVRDINTQPAIFSSNPQNFFTIGSTTLFVAETPEIGSELWKTDGTAAGTALVKDINPFGGSSPSWLTAANGVLYFAVDDGAHGLELWKTDGTTAGTVLVKDINPGAAGSNPSPLTEADGVLFFTADDGTHGVELWKTDGTAAGTALVSDIKPGTEGSYPRALTKVNETLFFTVVSDPAHGPELWKSDGTAAGTVLVRPGVIDDPTFLVEFNAMLLFLAENYQLWRSDGTTAGTVRLTRTGFPVGPKLTEVDGTLFFMLADGELWKTDGTVAGTGLVKDINPGPNPSFPTALTNLNGTLFFMAFEDIATFSSLGLWKSDGSTAGTVLVKYVNLGGQAGYPGYPFEIENVNGTLFFKGDDGATGGELWKSDGTEAGTELVRDITPGPQSSDISFVTVLNGKLLFRARDGVSVDRLWSSDGTAAGTVALTSDFYTFCESATVDGTLFFTKYDPASGVELWRSDGTPARTGLLRDVYPGPGSSNPGIFMGVNGMLLFSADDGSSGRELWKSDGTGAGTMRVMNVAPEGERTQGSDPGVLTDLNGTLFFNASDGVAGSELWTSDGTASGTGLVKDIWPGQRGSAPQSLATMNGKVFFSANDSSGGTSKLWKSDGTTDGTVLVKDLSLAWQGSPESSTLTNVDGTLFFFADDGMSGLELWKSDGTAGGTALVKDICPGACGQLFSEDCPCINCLSTLPECRHGPPKIANIGGTLFFVAVDPEWPLSQLWKSDGTESGTVRVSAETVDFAVSPFSTTVVGERVYVLGDRLWSSDGSTAGTVPLHPGELQSIASLTAVDGTLFFTANNPKSLWKSDGTEAGTVLVKDVWPRRSGYYSPEYGPESLTSVNGTLFFTANDGTTGRELWKSDGTTDGTVLVTDINPGLRGSNPTALTNVDGRLVFQACEQQSGCEVWASDGTTAGTRLLADIEPGAASSSPSGFTRSGSLLYFSAQDLPEGRELRAVPLSVLQVSTCVGDCDGKGSVTVDELLTMVNIALGNAQAPACPHGVPRGAAVNIALIIQAVNVALTGCGG